MNLTKLATTALIFSSITCNEPRNNLYQLPIEEKTNHQKQEKRKKYDSEKKDNPSDWKQKLQTKYAQHLGRCFSQNPQHKKLVT